MHVFVTGGTGYVGAHVVRELLDSAHDVTVLARDPGPLQGLASRARLRVVVGDLEHAWDEEALGDHDACVHAAIVWDAVRPEPEHDEIASTRRVFDAAARARVPHVLFVSSVAVHRPFAARMSEADVIAPTDEYGRAKAGAEAHLLGQHGSGLLRASIVRPGPVVGAPAVAGGRLRSDRRIEDMVRAARAGEPLDVLRGEGRQLTPAPGLARLVRTLLERAESPTIVVAVARALTTWESIARTASARFGGTSEVIVTEPAIGAVVPRFDTGAVERALGEPLDAAAALEEHLALLARGDASMP